MIAVLYIEYHIFIGDSIDWTLDNRIIHAILHCYLNLLIFECLLILIILYLIAKLDGSVQAREIDDGQDTRY